MVGSWIAGPSCAMSRSLLRRDDKESVGTTKSVLGDKECFGDDEKSILVICVMRFLLRGEQVPPASGRQRKTSGR